MYKIVINNKNIINIDIASTFMERLLGLMGKTNFNGLLFKQENSHRIFSSIHTSFMRESIDVIYLDENMDITEMTTLKPWKLYIPQHNNTKYIIELPENSIKRNNININTKIKVVKLNEKK